MKVSKDDLLATYKKMPIEQLASIEKSYREEDFTTEAKEIIRQVLSDRGKELDEYWYSQQRNGEIRKHSGVRESLGISFGQHVLIIIGIFVAISIPVYHIGYPTKPYIFKLLLLVSIGLSYLSYVIIHRSKLYYSKHEKPLTKKIEKGVLAMKTNRQNIIIIIVGIIVAIMMAFPPYHIKRGHIVINSGYGFIGKPPQPGSYIDLTTLILQIMIVVIIGAILYFLLCNRNKNQ